MGVLIPFDRRKTQPTDPYICPCGEQWFTLAYRFTREGKQIERENVAHCRKCGRGHPIRKQQPKEQP